MEDLTSPSLYTYQECFTMCYKMNVVFHRPLIEAFDAVARSRNLMKVDEDGVPAFALPTDLLLTVFTKEALEQIKQEEIKELQRRRNFLKNQLATEQLSHRDWMAQQQAKIEDIDAKIIAFLTQKE
jgi:hypothetical protein